MKYIGKSPPLFQEALFQSRESMKGIYTSSDLYNLSGKTTKIAQARIVRKMANEGILIPVQRGIYVTKEFDLWTLASRIEKKSYISMESVLSRNGLVGTTFEKTVSVVTTKNRPRLKAGDKEIRFHKVKPDLFFGFSKQGPVDVADNEKAYIDLLYFYLKGRRYAFDPLTEVDVPALDEARFKTYLKKYGNPKFISFVKGTFYGNRQSS